MYEENQLSEAELLEEERLWQAQLQTWREEDEALLEDDEYWAAVEKARLAEEKASLAAALTGKAEEVEDTWATTNEENPGYPNGAGVQEKELIRELADGDSDEDTAISDAITTIFNRFDKLLAVTFPDGIADEVYCDLCDWLKNSLAAFNESRQQFKCDEIIEEIQYETENVSTPEGLLKNLERYAVWASRDEERINDWCSSFGWIYKTSDEAWEGLAEFIETEPFLRSEFDLDALMDEALGYNAVCGYYYEKSPDLFYELLPKYDRGGSYDTFEEAKKYQIEDILYDYAEDYLENYEDLDIDEIAQRLILKDKHGKYCVEKPGSGAFWEAVQG